MNILLAKTSAPEISNPSLPKFLNSTFSKLPFEKSISKASDFEFEKFVSLIEKGELTIFKESSDRFESKI